MSKLIQLRHRIKAIETIKKITHAMRLISMSAHSQLKHQQTTIKQYTHLLEKLCIDLQAITPTWHNELIHPSFEAQPHRLIILIGSQKGLCGSFNINLYKLFNNYLENSPSNIKTSFIAVGQKSADFLRKESFGLVIDNYEKFTAQRIGYIAQKITHTISTAQPYYHEVLVFSNIFKNFFTQKPHRTQLIPALSPKTADLLHDDYIWQQNPNDILDTMIPQYIESRIYHLLFESLLSEHAARFISMDSSTRNANNLLDVARLQYNKLRQAKITKELTELIGSFE